VGPRTVLVAVGKRKIPSPLQESNPDHLPLSIVAIIIIITTTTTTTTTTTIIIIIIIIMYEIRFPRLWDL
jgi:hypothetical protein